MTYYFRQTGSDHIQGPLSLAKIRDRMPDLIDGEFTEVAESKGQSLEALRFETRWIPLMRALEAEEVERSSPAYVAAISAGVYDNQRNRIDVLSRVALIMTVIYQVIGLAMAIWSLKGGSNLGPFPRTSIFEVILHAFFTTIVLVFFIIAAKYAALAAIDIAEKQK
jgi:hypothetical protein